MHEGHGDVNENFRWATAHITGIRRVNVEVRELSLLSKEKDKLRSLRRQQQSLLFSRHRSLTTQGVDAYVLLKHRFAVFTLKALKKLLKMLEEQHRSRLPKCATPDGRPAPVPLPVPGWGQEWFEAKRAQKLRKFDRVRLLFSQHNSCPLQRADARPQDAFASPSPAPQTLAPLLSCFLEGAHSRASGQVEVVSRPQGADGERERENPSPKTLCLPAPPGV